MNLKRRLQRLEEQSRRGRPLGRLFLRIPWVDEEERGGIEIDGEFLSWGELEERFPEAPRPLRWAEPQE